MWHGTLAVVITFICMFPVVFNDWTNWDDSFYVTQNEVIKSFDWSHWWSIFHPSMRVFDTYTPLTLLSLAFDYKMAGLQPAWYHSINLILHLTNTFLVFLLFHRLKLDLRVSMLIALLFGIHPMHVESVAWITERKDLLFTFFYLFATLEYLKATSSSRTKKINGLSVHFVWSVLFFLMSMLSKPQAMTLPIMLLLLDYWNHRKPSKFIALEKLPYFLIALTFGIVSVYYQQDYPYSVDIGERVGLSGTALVIYFNKFFSPIHLSAFYPFAQFGIEKLGVSFYLAALLLILLVALGLWQRNGHRFILFGAAFFVLHLLPILHLVKVNSSIIYERFTYLSYIGLSFSFALFLEFVLKRYYQHWSRPYYFIIVLLSVTMGYLTFERTKVWENSETLWTSVIQQYPENYLAYGHRANFFVQQNDVSAALEDYEACLTLNPSFALGWNNRGLLYYRQKKYTRAIQDFTKAIPFDNESYEFRFNRITTNLVIDSIDLVLKDLEFILAQNPNEVRAHMYMGTTYTRLGSFDQSLKHYNTVLKLIPNHRSALLERTVVNLNLNANRQALEDVNNYLTLEPNNPMAYFYRSQAWKNLKEFSFAKRDAAIAERLGLRIDPDYLNSIN